MSDDSRLDIAQLRPRETGAALPYEFAALENRSSPRARIEIPASLRRSGCSAFAVTVRDLSQSGFSCRAVTGMPAGERCWLGLPGIVPQQARIVWNDGSAVGGEFETLLNIAVLEAMIGRYAMATV